MMPRRDRDHYRRTPTILPTIETGLVEMMARDNAKMREAGCNLAEAAGRVIREYDGLHRLSIAISAWYSAIAGEGDRDTRHAASADTHPKGGDVEQAPSLMSGAVPEGQTPNPSIPSPGSSDDV
jgi:hypothetical protein